MATERERREGEVLRLTAGDVRELLELIDRAETKELHLGFRGFTLSVRKAPAGEGDPTTEERE